MMNVKSKRAKKWLSRVLIAFISVLGLSLSPLPADATPLLHFAIPALSPSVGTNSFAGGSSPLVGSGITGNFIGSRLLSFAFGGAGLSTPSPLLAGAFNSPVSVPNFGGTSNILAGGFRDTKNPLLAFFGGTLNSQFTTPTPLATIPSSAAFTSTAIHGGNVTNTPTPEPGTLLLIGSGLVGIGVGARRRSRQK